MPRAALAVFALFLAFASEIASADDLPAAKFLLEWGQKGDQPGEFNSPIGIAINQRDEVFVTDLNNARVQRFSSDGKHLGGFDLPNDPVERKTSQAGGIACDDNGNLFVSFMQQDKIRVFTESGEPVREWGTKGNAEGELNGPGGIVFASDGTLYIADQRNHRMQRFTAEGKFLTAWGKHGSEPGEFDGKEPAGSRFGGPHFVARDNRGRVYTTEGAMSRVQQFSPEGRPLLGWGSKGNDPGGFGDYNFGNLKNTFGPIGIAVDRFDRVYVSSLNDRVQVFSPEGEFLFGIGAATGGDEPGQFHKPHGMAFDSRGHLYVADAGNQRIQKFEVPSPPRGVLEAGVAVVDITAPLGYRMSGYFNERLNTGTHDPLEAKAVVFRQGNQQVAFVFCDLIGIPASVSGPARDQAAQKTGIPASNILIHGTHSHTGPLYTGALRNHFHDLAVEKHGTDPHEVVDYAAFLIQRIVEAISQAQSAAQPVELRAGIAQQRGLSFNRRFHMKDGSVRFNPGKLNPDMIRPCGPIDSDVGIVLLRSAGSEQNLAALTVFPLHLDTVGGTEYSADYPFYLERNLRTNQGNHFVSLFGNGTCGDINHIDVTNAVRQSGQEESARIGAALAETVRQTLPSLQHLSGAKLAAKSAIVNVSIQQYSPEEITQAKQDIFKVGTSQLPFLDQVKVTKIMNVQLRPSGTFPLEVQVFRFNDDLAIVSLPGEVFVELGLAIKRGSPFSTTLVIELCNDNPAYIPTKKAFAEGSYETVNSILQPGGGELLVETALRLLKEAKSAD